MKSVLLIDDHPVVAVGLSLALKESTHFQISGVLADPADAKAQIAIDPPDALIIDVVFDGAVQLSLIAECRAALPQAAIVVFSSLPERLYARQALEAGADAYLNKAADLPALLQRLSEIFASRSAKTLPARVPTAAEGDGGPDQIIQPQIILDSVHLTPRETEIARRLGHGLSIALIAQEIGISSNTVAVHRDNIRKKLNCRDTKDLVARLARMDHAGNVRS